MDGTDGLLAEIALPAVVSRGEDCWSRSNSSMVYGSYPSLRFLCDSNLTPTGGHSLFLEQRFQLYLRVCFRYSRCDRTCKRLDGFDCSVVRVSLWKLRRSFYQCAEAEVGALPESITFTMDIETQDQETATAGLVELYLLGVWEGYE